MPLFDYVGTDELNFYTYVFYMSIKRIFEALTC